MAKPFSLTTFSLLLLRSKLTPQFSRTLSLFVNPRSQSLFTRSHSFTYSLRLSTTSSPYPLQYDLIVSKPSQSSLSPHRRRCPKPTNSTPLDSSEPEQEPEPSGSELCFENWVDKKLSEPQMDKSKRKYYNKRRKRMYGTDSDDERKNQEDGFVELKPEVVEFHRLHKREEELYFYDTFAYPWDKEKHYKMVYQLEKKYFPDQCLDKAFVDIGQSTKDNVKEKTKLKKKKVIENGGENKERDDKGLIFFEEVGEKYRGESPKSQNVGVDISEKKVEEFFKHLKKVPGKDANVVKDEPYMLARRTELPPKWDAPWGTVVLVNKPKGWTSFTVCGKLRRLVKVKKVGHAGTLDPMATGLLIVCVGKATKLVDRYQGMMKGYSGVFRLGEATSTWDADSPVIQREPWEHIKDEDIKKTAASFCGEIWQVPPMFSAIKVGGEKMYEKARRGESIELSPRRISIFQFDIERSLEDRQNLIFRVTCSKGTYIRSLCADFGKALGSCAHLTSLRRDSIGQYSADDAWEFKELEEAITRVFLPFRLTNSPLHQANLHLL
ncbi:tRNA pseudouridylate synthase B, C-terminal [Dillenia turbinata]|uniref:tRNA pseudouridine(55) synthase n=1 Tax=Dillenia turbinata TaxID=194707 RepID=A0AAN8UCZ0_9MAGN